MDQFWKMICNIEEQEEIPDVFRESTLVPIFKGEGEVQECGNCWGIKVLSYTRKVLERLLDKRLRQESEVS